MKIEIKKGTNINKNRGTKSSKTKVDKMIKYENPILENIFKCKICGHPLLMYGCDNPDCENYNSKRMVEKDNKED